MLAARAQHVAEVIEPALAERPGRGLRPLLRLHLAYQGYGRGLDLSELAHLDCWASGAAAPLTSSCCWTCPSRRPGSAVQVGRPTASRARARSSSSVSRTGSGSLAAAPPARWRVVDASGDVAEVAAAVRAAVG